MNRNDMVQMGIRTPEILSPAGSMEVLMAAVEAGCDAVYLGGSQFGARAFAGNFDTEELLEAIAYVHQRGCSIYLTVNTLLKQKEIDEKLIRYLLPFYEAGLDAVIVQELGVFERIRASYPDLPIHVSTQAGIMSEYGASLMKKMGAVRVVPARELSLSEIERITAIEGLEVECFVHGALCYSYSGHCQLSSCVGSRSGNRGRCAQPCRLPYKVLDSQNRVQTEMYALSPKDMCAITILPELIAAGIDSFKIEGRMKKSEYVSVVTMLYRIYRDKACEVLCSTMQKWNLNHVRCIKELDAEMQKKFWDDVYSKYIVDEKDSMLLLQMYNRGGFTKGYFQQKNGKDMMTMNRPNHHGVYLGKVEGIGKGNISFTTQEDLYAKDIIEVRIKDDTIELTSPISAKKGERVTLNAPKVKKIKAGQQIYRMKSSYWIEDVKKQIKVQQKDVLLDVQIKLYPGEQLMLRLSETESDSEDVIELYGEMVQKAVNAPVEQKQIEKAIRQTGGTGYAMNQVFIEMKEDCFISMKAIKEIRREAIQLLVKKKQNRLVREVSRINQIESEQTAGFLKKSQKHKDSQFVSENPLYAVSVRRLEQWEMAVASDNLAAIYVDSVLLSNQSFRSQWKTYRKDTKIYYILPRMFRYETAKKLEQDPALSQFDGFVAGSNDALCFALQYAQTQKKNYELVLDYSLYTFNQQAARQYADIIDNSQYGVLKWINAPYEITLQELKQANVQPLQMQVYGRRTVMTSAQCLVRNHKGCYSKMQTNKLQDRKGKNYIVYNNCEFCNNQLVEEEPLSMHGMAKDIMTILPESVRFDFTEESRQEMEFILDAFRKELEEGLIQDVIQGNTGHYFHPVD